MPQNGASEGTTRPRVLIVDDCRVDRELMRESIAAFADVTCCESGEEALRLLRERRPDLVLTDVAMAGMSGLDLLAHIARDYPDVDVVVATAHASLDTALQAMRMGAADYLPKPFRPEELSVVIARTFERRRLRTENERLRNLLAVVDDCRSLAVAVEPTEIHGATLDVLLRRLGRTRGLSILTGNFELGGDDVLVRGFDDAVAARLRSEFSSCKVAEVDSFEEPKLVGEGPLNAKLQAAGATVRESLVVPLDVPNGDGDGYLILPDGEAPFRLEDLEIARMVVSYGQVGVYNAERYLRAKERAFVDEVTGAYNARFLFAALEHELRRVERYASQLTVIFLDIDRFKLVNDRYGHLVGSRTLYALAQVLGNCIRQVDTLARYGGDEFAILLADTPHERGCAVAERIRAAVARARFEGSKALHITASLGVASHPEHGATSRQLLDAADKAMYRGKSLGRNRICSAAEL